MQDINVLVYGSDRGGDLAARLARLGHRVVCADPNARVMCENSWDVVAIDAGGCHDHAELMRSLPPNRGATMVVGEDPRRLSIGGPMVFCFRDESDAGYARALHMCAALGGGSDSEARSPVACATDREPQSGRRWGATPVAV